MYGTEANEATQTHCYNPVAPAYPIWAYYAHGQRRCQEDPASLPSGRLEKTTRSSPYYVAQHRPTGSETPPPYAPRSSRFGSEPPSVEDDVDVWRYTILELYARNDDDDDYHGRSNKTNQSCLIVFLLYVLLKTSEHWALCCGHCFISQVA